MDRRTFLMAGIGAGTVASMGLALPKFAAAAGKDYELPALPYGFDALEPYIDKMTMEIHHDRHHKAYVDNANKALDGHADLAKLSVEQLLRDINKVPENIRLPLSNNAGGHANHTMFWEIMAKNTGG